MTDDRQQRKKSRALILPKNLEFWKDCLFLKNGENLIFSQVRPCDERGKWRTTDDGDDRRHRKNLVHSFWLKIMNFGKIAFFSKNSENLIFFTGPSLWRKREMTDDRRRRRPTTPKKSRTLILPKNHEFRKDCFFFEKQWEFDFFHRSVPVTKEGNDGWPTTDNSTKNLGHSFCLKI